MKKLGDPIECPFCGEKTVSARISTTYYFVSEHQMCNNGVNMDGDTMGQILGEMTCDPVMKYAGFSCDSCGKKWSPYDYALAKDDDGMFFFEKQEKNLKRKGRKSNE